MSVSNAERHQLHGELERVLGPQGAETLMEYLPPVGWADVATKRDLDGLEERMRAEMRVLRSEMGALRSDMTGEIGTLRSEMTGEIGTLRSDMTGEIGTLRSDMTGEIGTLRSDMTGMFVAFHSKVEADLGAVRSEMAVGLAGVANRLDVETANRRTDVEKVEKSMAGLKVAIMREQRIHLTVMVTVLSGIAALITLFG